MREFNFSLSNLNLISISCIQLAVAIVISLIFQFLIPFSWQPLDTFQYGVKQHGDPGPWRNPNHRRSAGG